MFADLVGSTSLAERLDPELFRELVMTFLGQVKWRLARAAARVAEGDRGDAERLAREAVGLAECTDSVVLHADALTGLAYALIGGGDAGASLEPCSCAIELYEAKGDVVSASRWQAVLEAHTPAA